MSCKLSIYIADLHDKTGMQMQRHVMYYEERKAVQGPTHDYVGAACVDMPQMLGA